MKGFFLQVVFTAFFALAALPACAQEEAKQDLYPTTPTAPSAMGEVSEEPQCFNIVNHAPYGIYGSINTNYFMNEDGVKTRHKSNFRLEPDSYAEFCTYGPFFDGRRIELVLRTLVPIFNCKTTIDEEIGIYGRRKSEGGTETWATCR